MQNFKLKKTEKSIIWVKKKWVHIINCIARKGLKTRHGKGWICKIRCSKVDTIKNKCQGIDGLSSCNKLIWIGRQLVQNVIWYWRKVTWNTVLFLERRGLTGMPMLIRCRTSTSFVNSLAPYCNPTPSMTASINPKTNPNCGLNVFMNF